MAFKSKDSTGERSEKVAAANRLLARMDKDELRQLAGYYRKRWKLLEQREEAARFKARYEAAWGRITNLSVGTPVIVNAAGTRQFPRGTILEIVSFNLRGRKCVRLKDRDRGRVFRFNAQHIDDFDIYPAGEVDLSKFPNVTHIAI